MASMVEEARREALGHLFERYKKPIYHYFRLKWKMRSDEAQDLTADFFTMLLVGDPDHGGIAHAGARPQHVFDLARVDVVARPDDQLLLAIDKEEVALRIEVTNVAGQQPAVRRQDRTAVYAMLNDFVIPYTKIRDREPGYSVSIVKAGLAAVGRPAGPVRPPLSDLLDSERDELQTLVDKVAGSKA
jgi:hypothetical protein